MTIAPRPTRWSIQARWFAGVVSLGPPWPWKKITIRFGFPAGRKSQTPSELFTSGPSTVGLAGYEVPLPPQPASTRSATSTTGVRAALMCLLRRRVSERVRSAGGRRSVHAHRAQSGRQLLQPDRGLGREAVPPASHEAPAEESVGAEPIQVGPGDQPRDVAVPPPECERGRAAAHR